MEAIICDLDDTLVFNPYWDGDLDKFYSDVLEGIPMYWCEDLLRRYSDVKILFITARDEKVRHLTEVQLNSWFDFSYELYMRPHGDLRTDCLVKEEYVIKLKEAYDILFAIDDNPANCLMYKSHGIPALRVY